MSTIPGRLTAAECAELVGVLPATWRGMVARSGTPARPSPVPQPVDRFLGRPLWDAEEVTSWARGYRKGRAARERSEP